MPDDGGDALARAVAAGEVGAAGRFARAVGSAVDGAARARLLDPLAVLARSSPDALGALLAAVLTEDLATPAIRSLLVGREDVEDVTQDVLIAVSRSIGAFRGDARFTTWLATVARNTAVAHLRRKREALSLDEVAAQSDGQRLSSMIATRAALRSAVERLEPAYRDPVVLRDVDHLPYQVIAERLGLNLNTVKSRIFRGRALLAAGLDAGDVAGA